MPGSSTFAVITGGGTAGHVLPALAIAETLVRRGHRPASIHYVGARRGIECRLLPDTPFPHTLLDVVGVQRSLSRRNLGFLPKLVRATGAATSLLRQLEPRAVVSVGGYASLPAVLAARRLGTPIVVVSFDRRPGRASTLAARFAAASAVAFDGSPLPRAEVTGAPVRQVILEVDRRYDRDPARAILGLPADRFVLAVTGGSQGSAALNAAIDRYARDHAADDDLAIHHVVGERFAADHFAADQELGCAGQRAAVIHRVIGYESHVEHVYAACDLLVARGGASTVAEVSVTGTPSILVPWAAAAEDHQTDNVRWLSDQDAAVHLAEASLTELGTVINELRGDPARRSSLAERAHRAGTVHRGEAIGALIERVALPGPATTGQ